MVDDVLEDLKSGSIQSLSELMDKLDKLVNKLGIDLKQYNKELVKFVDQRKDNQIIRRNYKRLKRKKYYR